MFNKIYKKFSLIGIIICIVIISNTIFANSVSLEEKVKEIFQNENEEFDITKIVTEYEKLSKEYTNEEIADYIEENKDKLEEKGISSDVISAGTEVLKTMDEETVTKVLKEDI